MSLKKLKEFIESKLSLKVSEKELQIWKEEYKANCSDNQNNDTQKQQIPNTDNQNNNTQKIQISEGDDSTN